MLRRIDELAALGPAAFAACTGPRLVARRGRAVSDRIVPRCRRSGCPATRSPPVPWPPPTTAATCTASPRRPSSSPGGRPGHRRRGEPRARRRHPRRPVRRHPRRRARRPPGTTGRFAALLSRVPGPTWRGDMGARAAGARARHEPFGDLTGRVVVVTGAGRGLGLAIAAELGAPAPGRRRRAQPGVRRQGRGRARRTSRWTCCVDTDVADEASVDALALARGRRSGRLGRGQQRRARRRRRRQHFADLPPPTSTGSCGSTPAGPSSWPGRSTRRCARRGRPDRQRRSDVAFYGPPRLLHYVSVQERRVGMTRAMARDAGPTASPSTPSPPASPRPRPPAASRRSATSCTASTARSPAPSSPTTSPAPCGSCSPTPPPTSPARRCWSTAASSAD